VRRTLTDRSRVTARLESAALRSDGRTAVLAAAGFIAPPLGLFAPLGLSPLLFFAAIGALVVAARERQWPLASRPLLIGFAALVAWSALSAIWAIDPAHSLLRALRLAAELGSGLILLDAAHRLTPRGRHLVLLALTAGLVLGALLVGLDRATDGALVRPFSQRYNGATAQDRGATVYAMLVWPALLWTGRRHGPLAALVLLALVAATILVLPSDAAKLALGVGGIVFLLGLGLGRMFAREGQWLVPLLLLAMPFLALSLPPTTTLAAMHDFKASGIHRLIIWRFAAEHVAERPILGWGLDASRDLPGMHERFALPVGTGGETTMVEMMPLHPHNNAIQLWLELGLPGALIGAALIAFVLRRLAAPDLDPGVRTVALAALAASLVIACLSYGLLQGWWLGALCLASLFATVVLPPRPSA
jgi:O-antigen ligase